MRFTILIFVILLASISALVIFDWYTYYEFAELMLCVVAVTYGLRLFMLHIEARRLAALILLAPAAGGVILFFCSPEWKGVRFESPLRVGPGDDYAKIDTLASNSLVTVISVNGDWARVIAEGDPPLEGYVQSSSLSFQWSSPNVAGLGSAFLSSVVLWSWTYLGEKRVRLWRMRRALRREVITELRRRYAENWDQRVHIAVPIVTELVEDVLNTAATRAQSEIEVRWLKSQLKNILLEIGIKDDFESVDTFVNKLDKKIDYKPVERGNGNE